MSTCDEFRKGDDEVLQGTEWSKYSDTNSVKVAKPTPSVKPDEVSTPKQSPSCADSRAQKSWEGNLRSRRAGMKAARKRKLRASQKPVTGTDRFKLRKGILHDVEDEKTSCRTEKTREEAGSGEADTESKRVSHLYVLSELHYVVSGSVGVSPRSMNPTPVVIETGSGYNVIRKSSLPHGWQRFITSRNNLPNLADASGIDLRVMHEVLLRLRCGNALYRVKLNVFDHLSVPVLFGTQFTNRHIDVIRCIKGFIEFTGDRLPIIGRGGREAPWAYQGSTIKEKTTLISGETAYTGDESHALARIRLTKRLSIPAFTQKRIWVTTLMKGLIVTEPKADIV